MPSLYTLNTARQPRLPILFVEHALELAHAHADLAVQKKALARLFNQTESQLSADEGQVQRRRAHRAGRTNKARRLSVG